MNDSEGENPIPLHRPSWAAREQKRIERQTKVNFVQSRKDGRNDLIDNSLRYHLSLMIALHQYFLSLPTSSVPSFLMIDQPSQVYFPKKLAGRITKNELDPKLDDDDAKRVRQLFIELAKITLVENKGKRNFQLIVVDHAGKSVWGDVPGVHLVEEWRGPKKLVPKDWIVPSR